MSLQTDRIFIAALNASEAIVEATEGRIYSTAIPMPEDDADNEPAPFIIVTFDGLVNDTYTKDYSFEGDTDNVRIGIEIVATTRDELADLEELVRAAVPAYFTNYEASDSEGLSSLVPLDYEFSAADVYYDEYRPAYGHKLQYNCTTNI